MATENCTSSPQIEFIIYCVITPVFQCLLAVFICGGNLMTIVAVCTTQSLQTTPNMYVVSLAVADLMVGVDVFFESFWLNALTESLIADCKYCCLVNLFTLYTSMFASMSSIVLIATDRFLFICYPFKYENWVTLRRTQIIIIATWFVSVIISTLPFFLNNFDVVQECTHNGLLPIWYQIFLEQILFDLVFILCVCLYAEIVKTARRQLRSIHASNLNSVHSSTEGKNWKVIRLMLLVCGGFFTCWCPYHICVVINYASYVSEDVMDVLFVLGILNSGVNFIIYVVVNKEFKKAFRRFLPCCRCTSKQDSDVYSLH